jgi:hypothetical protein
MLCVCATKTSSKIASVIREKTNVQLSVHISPKSKGW